MLPINSCYLLSEKLPTQLIVALLSCVAIPAAHRRAALMRAHAPTGDRVKATAIFAAVR
jgi:hypothetical protein